MSKTSDLHVVENDPLRSPQDLISSIAATEANTEFVQKTRESIQKILKGEDPRLLLVIGPCSIHDVDAGREYAGRLQKLAAEVNDVILVVMRVYFEKPRTTVGWKGLIMDPDLDGTCEIEKGLEISRRFLLDVLELEMPTATELLDPISPQYIADLICWSAVGARTTESQTHRQMASGLSMPLGFKNGTNGSIGVAVNAIRAAIQPQTFLGVNMEGHASSVSTIGNPDCHLILRGGDDGPNYSEKHVAAAMNALRRSPDPIPDGIMIDTSHANCDKKHDRQPDVFREIVRQRIAGNDRIIGAMVESNLVAGNQKFPVDSLDLLVRGQSITDPCIDWETTDAIVREAAESLRGQS